MTQTRRRKRLLPGGFRYGRADCNGFKEREPRDTLKNNWRFLSSPRS